MLIGQAAKCSICGKIILKRGAGNLTIASGRVAHAKCFAEHPHDISARPIPSRDRAGYYRELTKKPANPFLADSIAPKGAEREGDIVRYLRSGIVLVSREQQIRDPLDDMHPVIGNGSILTDAIWDWPDYLPRLVEKYHVTLPDAFLEHMKESNWSIPGLALSGQ